MLLITAYNPHQAQLGELTAPLMEAYAKRHRLGFRCVRIEAEGKEAYWQKIILTLDAFREGFDWVFWLDADQAITNPEILPPAGFLNGFAASMDWGRDAKSTADFSMCGYVAHSGIRRAFDHVNDRHDECIGGPFPEQTPMREYFREHHERFRSLGRDLNKVPDEVSPGNVVEPWQPGDFSAHLTHLPNVERVALFHKIMGRLKR